MRILAIADDMTGALEVGAMFANNGVRTLVTLDTEVLPEAEAVVVDARTRHLPRAEAGDRVARLAALARAAGVPYIYKKTDSTLRGNIAAEFQALLRAFPEMPLIYAPAYPQMGRTVTGAELLVHGLPLAESPFARDPLNPSAEGSIPRLLAQSCDAPVAIAGTRSEAARLLTEVPPGTIVICDGASPEDLEAAAAALAASARPCLAAGTAGFCAPWVRSLTLLREAAARCIAVGRCLVVNGSLNPVSLGQVRRAAGELPVITLAEDPAGDTATTDSLTTAFGKHRWVALTTPGTCPNQVAERIGELARETLSRGLADGLVVFGGDTALAVLEALGVSTVEPCRELIPGVPFSVVRMETRDLALITKAGGFGDSDTLLSIRDLLEKEP